MREKERQTTTNCPIVIDSNDEDAKGNAGNKDGLDDNSDNE
jgi:hypothetical protein